MQIKTLLLIFITLNICFSQPYITNYPANHSSVRDNNPKFNPNNYDPGCCPNKSLSFSSQFTSISTKPAFIKKCPCSHYVFAIDKSGSMNWFGEWGPAKSLLDSWVSSLIVPGSHNFVTYYEFNQIASLPPHFHVSPFLSPSSFLTSPSGGTSFNAAIWRAIDVITPYLTENTCFFIITDGFGSVNIPTPYFNLVGLLQKVRGNGCRTCSYCFWWNFVVPSRLSRQQLQARE